MAAQTSQEFPALPFQRRAWDGHSPFEANNNQPISWGGRVDSGPSFQQFQFHSGGVTVTQLEKPDCWAEKRSPPQHFLPRPRSELPSAGLQATPSAGHGGERSLHTSWTAQALLSPTAQRDATDPVSTSSEEDEILSWGRPATQQHPLGPTSRWLSAEATQRPPLPSSHGLPTASGSALRSRPGAYAGLDVTLPSAGQGPPHDAALCGPSWKTTRNQQGVQPPHSTTAQYGSACSIIAPLGKAKYGPTWGRGESSCALDALQSGCPRAERESQALAATWPARQADSGHPEDESEWVQPKVDKAQKPLERRLAEIREAQEDVELRILMERLELLKSQRELAAVRCQRFTNMLESFVDKQRVKVKGQPQACHQQLGGSDSKVAHGVLGSQTKPRPESAQHKTQRHHSSTNNHRRHRSTGTHEAFVTNSPGQETNWRYRATSQGLIPVPAPAAVPEYVLLNRGSLQASETVHHRLPREQKSLS